MNDTDTSDVAFVEWYERYCHDENISPLHIHAWREAVRRCEAQMEERENSAFCYAAGWVKGIMVSGNVPTTDQILAACQAFKEQ